MLQRKFLLVSLTLIAGFTINRTFAQPTWTLDPFGKEKKPKQFEERKLGSEKTAEKKFTKPRHVIQNTVTHYNYYFNASNKISSIIERAKGSQNDDLTKLLSFYPYSLENTASQKQDLDSVIYKCTAGILIHDLRNDWIDNLYLLIGKAYFFKNDFDSAANTFQFINYNLFPRKKKEDDNKIVGTNEGSGLNVVSIANKEKLNIFQKIASLPPSRNDAFIWLSRTLIEQNEMGDAAGLINTLQNDINLPRRLKNDLEEVTAYWFFKQGIFDSAAVHLEKSLSIQDNKQDLARAEFLLAQLFEMNKTFDKASDYFARASKHTTDPVMDIFARLNDAKMMRSTGDIKELENAVDNLVKMARKDKYDSYRDIIYYSAGQLILQKPDTNAAIGYFTKSLKYNESNISYKNKTFLLLGDIAYNRRQYKESYNWYDSLQTGDTTLGARLAQIETRKAALGKIVTNIAIIEREDSLQRIAGMPVAEREIFIKKLLRKLRKEKGLKDEEPNLASNEPITFNNTNNQPTDLFKTNSKGEWYFYNSSLKSSGYSDFKTKWGSRVNVDNWRRKSAIVKSTIPVNNGIVDTKPVVGLTGDVKNKLPGEKNGNTTDELTFDGLLNNLPLTPEKTGNSNDMISGNLLLLAKTYQDELEDYELAAATYEEYLTRYPDKLIDGEVYLGLYYCYTKLANTTRANYYKNLLNAKFKDTKYGKMANNPASLNPKKANPEATKKYENIYALFIEGKFEDALAEKKAADNIYGNNFWSPQLLYIEAIYYVKQKDDSTALKTLNSIITLYPKSPLKEKAENLVNTLKKRKEIEEYLTNLQVTRMAEDKKINADEKPAIVNQAPVTQNPVQTVIPNNKQVVTAPSKDTAKTTAPPPLSNGGYTLNNSAVHLIIMILDKVDGVYVNESKNAFDRYNRTNFYSTPITITKEVLDADKNILTFSSFANAEEALAYFDKLKRAAPREVSWLPATKYSFVIITDENLQVLKKTKNISDYKKLLNTQYPGRF
jgi:tetratricopeptide (TPR) repeat protein